MRERKIAEAEVCSVLQSRGMVYPAKQGKTNVSDRVAGRLIRVTVRETDTTCKIVTVVAPEESEGANQDA
jgi:hypothetical protein